MILTFKKKKKLKKFLPFILSYFLDYVRAKIELRRDKLDVIFIINKKKKYKFGKRRLKELKKMIKNIFLSMIQMIFHLKTKKMLIKLSSTYSMFVVFLIT